MNFENLLTNSNSWCRDFAKLCLELHIDNFKLVKYNHLQVFIEVDYYQIYIANCVRIFNSKTRITHQFTFDISPQDFLDFFLILRKVDQYLFAPHHYSF